MIEFELRRQKRGETVQESAKEWSLGFVKQHAPTARGDQDAGITQPRNNFLACMYGEVLREVKLQIRSDI